MRFNSLLNLTGFSGKAHGEPPASGCVADTRMPETPAPSQGSFRANFSRYLPLSGGDPRPLDAAQQAELKADSLRLCICRGENQVDQADQRGHLDLAHHKRRVANFERRLMTLEAEMVAGRIRLCFGSKRLWPKQHHLGANG